MLKGSIEAKQQAEQDALRMSFILQKESRSGASASKRRASPIFRRCGAGISPQLLEWKGIEATEKTGHQRERESRHNRQSKKWSAAGAGAK